MELTWQSIITAGGVLSALLLLLTTYNRVYRWTLRQKEQDEELKAIRKENTLLTYGVLACLKGMAEQGCNGPVRPTTSEPPEKQREERTHMKQLLQLIDVKSLVTLAMTGAMIALLFAPVDPNPEAQSLFCTAYGAIITYFFTKRTQDQKTSNEEDQP